MMPKFFKIPFGVVMLALLLATPALRAEDAPAAMPQVAIFAVKSIDDVTAFVKKTGLELPPDLSAAAIERQFQFIGAGGLATDRPIGVVVCGGKDLAAEQMMAFVFPLKPGAATIASLKTIGATPMPGHADALVLDSVGFRRTADYLIFSPNAAVAVNADPDALVAAVKGADSLAKLSGDLKVLRTSFPEQYKKMMSVFESGAAQDATTDAERATKAASIKPFEEMLDTVDKMEVSLENGERGVRLAVSVTPLKVATATAAAIRPGMPAGAFARVDINLASNPSTAAMRDALQKAFNSGMGADTKLTETQKVRLERVGNQFGALIADPATTSLGVDVVDGKPVLYVVQHQEKHVDVPAEWKRLITELTDILGKQPNDVPVATYNADGVSVTRITLVDKQTIRLDVAQKDNDVYITVSTSEAHLLAPLLAADKDGAMKGVFAGSIDLGKMVDAFGKADDSPLAGLPPEMQKKIADALRDQTVGISTSAEGNTGTLDITLSKGLLESIAKLVATFNPPPGDKPDAK